MTASVECLDAVAEHRVGLFAHAFVCMADFAGMFAGEFRVRAIGDADARCSGELDTITKRYLGGLGNFSLVSR